MAFPILLSQISQTEERAEIARDLTIEPTLPSGGNPKASRTGKTLGTVKPPFPFLMANVERDELRVPLFYAQTKFGKETIEATDADANWKPLTSEKSHISLREAQFSIVAEAVEHLREHRTTTIQAQPGAGKTIMATLLALKLGLRFCVLYPYQPLEKQWLTTAASVMTGKDKYDKKDPSFDGFWVVDQPAVASRKFEEKGGGGREFDAMFSLGDRTTTAISEADRATIGTLIIDEAHLFCTPSSVNTILSFEPKYVIILTATLERSDGAHKMMHLLAGEHDIFRPPKRDYRLIAFKSKVVIPEKINRITGTLDYTSLCSDMAANEQYNREIVDFVVANPTRKFMVLSRLVSHAETLKDALAAKGIETDVLCGRRKKCSDSSVLVGTFQKIGTGFDAATFLEGFDGRAPDALILTHTIKQWQSYTQIVGRVMRADPKVTPIVVFMMTQNPVTSRHLSGLSRYIRETGGTLEKVSEPFTF
jgi:superfamily II DNA or RNA helicase